MKVYAVYLRDAAGCIRVFSDPVKALAYTNRVLRENSEYLNRGDVVTVELVVDSEEE